jgi:hypothetical protein
VSPTSGEPEAPRPPTEPPSPLPAEARDVRVERPHTQLFRTPARRPVARDKAHEGRSPGQRYWARAKAVLVGRPLATEEEATERLSKKKALAIFSSDAISSSAYATEEIVRVLVLGGTAALFFSVEVALAVAILLALVAFSYRQVVYAYPNGGGSYSVSKQNFGRDASLIAASALLIDYVLTVSVSTSSAVEQIGSAIPALQPWSVAIGVGAIALITLGNLRGLSGGRQHLRRPTYLFVFRPAHDRHRRLPIVVRRWQPYPRRSPTRPRIRSRRSASSCSSGFPGRSSPDRTEARSTALPAFQPPGSRNAARPDGHGCPAHLFVGITFVATAVRHRPPG